MTTVGFVRKTAVHLTLTYPRRFLKTVSGPTHTFILPEHSGLTKFILKDTLNLSSPEALGVVGILENVTSLAQTISTFL